MRITDIEQRFIDSDHFAEAVQAFAEDHYRQCTHCEEWFDGKRDLDDNDLCAECAENAAHAEDNAVDAALEK